MNRLPRLHRPSVLLAVSLLAAALLAPSAPASAASANRPRPLGLDRSGTPQQMADPAVTKLPDGRYVAFATGPRIRRFVAPGLGGPWTPRGKALADTPDWLKVKGGDLAYRTWAPEIHHDTAGGRDRWLMYYSAPPRPGLRSGHDENYRCLSVAVASSPTGRFTTPASLDKKPLYCLSSSPGIIDPSVLVDGGRSFLLYKTRQSPARLKSIRLGADLLSVVRSTDRQLAVDREHTIENPVIRKFGPRYVLFTSHGDYASCSYRTDYLVSKNLSFTGPRRTLIKPSGDLCGPGGADVVATGSSGPVLALHGTMRKQGGRWVPGVDRGNFVRTLYAVHVGFQDGKLRLGQWVRPS